MATGVRVQDFRPNSSTDQKEDSSQSPGSTGWCPGELKPCPPGLPVGRQNMGSSFLNVSKDQDQLHGGTWEWISSQLHFMDGKTGDSEGNRYVGMGAAWALRPRTSHLTHHRPHLGWSRAAGQGRLGTFRSRHLFSLSGDTCLCPQFLI